MEFSNIKFWILVRLSPTYAASIDATGQDVYWQLCYGFRLFYQQYSVHCITIRGPSDEHSWLLNTSPNVVLLGTRTFVHLAGSPYYLVRHINSTFICPTVLVNGFDLFTFDLMHYHVFGQTDEELDRYFGPDILDEGVSTYLDLQNESEFVLVVDVGQTLSSNRAEFFHRYQHMLPTILNIDDELLDIN